MELTHIISIGIGLVVSAFLFLRLRLQVTQSKLTRMETKSTDEKIKAEVHGMSDDALNADLRKNLSSND